MRSIFRFPAHEIPSLKDHILKNYSRREHFLLLDSNQVPDKYGTFDWIAAIGAKKVFLPSGHDPFNQLYDFHRSSQDWLFGHLGYDLKNDLESLHSHHPDHLGWEKMCFFIPQTVIYRKQDEVTVESLEFSSLTGLLERLTDVNNPLTAEGSLSLQPVTTRENYLDKVRRLKQHLQYGNIYEVNYCIEFAARHSINPLAVFTRLNGTNRSPFSAFYRMNNRYLLCSSPERFIKKSQSRIISQPIKGTVRRSSVRAEDEQLKEQLQHNPKERSENVMIVDLVRNDLSRTAAPGSVRVEELFGIYSYPAVHQMVSTICSDMRAGTRFTDVLRYCFPMGSMTGAPKIRAMELIEEHESFSRSLYSGSVGYITPAGDFDFNVVIRSLFYNSLTHYISARVGSAITIHCDPEKEYEECLLKAENLFKALRGEAEDVSPGSR